MVDTVRRHRKNPPFYTFSFLSHSLCIQEGWLFCPCLNKHLCEMGSSWACMIHTDVQDHLTRPTVIRSRSFRLVSKFSVRDASISYSYYQEFYKVDISAEDPFDMTLYVQRRPNQPRANTLLNKRFATEVPMPVIVGRLVDWQISHPLLRCSPTRTLIGHETFKGTVSGIGLDYLYHF